jgi:GNAT superfamily N-acetyltransferase
MQWMIRDVPASQADALVPLVMETQAIHARAHPQIFRADAERREILESLRSWLGLDTVTALAALDGGGRVIGYAIVEAHEQPKGAYEHGLRTGFLSHVAVVEAWRRRGVALSLIDEVKARLRSVGIERLRTSYHVFNRPSEALMRRAGLQPLFTVAEGSTHDV